MPMANKIIVSSSGLKRGINSFSKREKRPVEVSPGMPRL